MHDDGDQGKRAGDASRLASPAALSWPLSCTVLYVSTGSTPREAREPSARSTPTLELSDDDHICATRDALTVLVARQMDDYARHVTVQCTTLIANERLHQTAIEMNEHNPKP